MIKRDKRIIKTEKFGKRQWKAPLMTQLDVRKTKSSFIPNETETLFTAGS